MTTCDHADDGPCTGGPGHFTPPGTDLTLCRRHRNQWRRANDKQVATRSRPRYAERNQEALDHKAQRDRMRVIENAANRRRL